MYKLIDGSTATGALTNPTVSDTAPTGAGVFTCDALGTALFIFGGSNAANETINYQVIGYRTTIGPAAGGTDYVPQIVAKGTATLGAMVYTNTDLGAATNFFADTITTTIAYSSTLTYSPADDTVARLACDVREFNYFKLEVDLGTAATSDAFWEGQVPPPGISTIVNVAIGDLNIGNVGILDVDEAEMNPSGGARSNVAKASGEMLSATGLVRTDTPALPEAVADNDWVAASSNVKGELWVSSSEIAAGTPTSGNATADADGSVREQLKYANDNTDTIAADTDLVAGAVAIESASWLAADTMIPAGTVRKSARALVGDAVDGEYTPVQTTDNGDLRTRDDDLNTALAVGTGVMASAQAVTLATDDTQFGAVGAASDVDGDVHGQLRFVGESVDTLESLLAVGTGAMASAQAVTIATDDTVLLAVNKAIVGASAPTIDSYTSAVVDVAAATANQVLIAAPGANKQIWVYGLLVGSAAQGTFTFQDEDDTALSGTIPVALDGGYVMPPSGNFSQPWIVVATNKALEVDTTGASATLDGIITYGIVSV